MQLKSKLPMLATAMAGLFLAQGAMHSAVIMPFWQKNYYVKGLDGEGLSPDQLLVAIAGFREMIAGILWVRADAFFDEGNYDAILPMIRLVTMLDPKQIDVYATGMWHIGYNFTDEESRSDRRYLPSAIALGKEGSRNNNYTYELYFETGWLWFHKIDDNYENAVNWFELANTKEDMRYIPARRNLLYKAYERNGQVDKTLDFQADLLKDAEEVVAKNKDDFQGRQQRDTVEKNLDNHLIRMAQRGFLAQKGGYYDQGQYDTKPPYPINFGARVTVVEPRVIRVEGNWGVLPIGTRVRFILRDEDFPNAIPGGMKWDQKDRVDLDTPKGITFLQDQLFVRDQRFSRDIDMSRDPTMYPLVKPKYTLEFYYNPRSAPAHMQDKFGWSGEGMTDPNFLNREIREGQRVIFARLELTRDQIFRRGEWEIGARTPIVQTKSFVERSAADVKGEVIKVPTAGQPIPSPTGTP